MTNRDPAAGIWTHGELPPSVVLGPGSVLIGDHVLRRFRSRHEVAVQVGSNSTLDGVHLALGEKGRVLVGDWSHLSSVMLLCEEQITIGSYVAIGWNTALADTDFHPLAPAARQQDAIACSPIADGSRRPPVVSRPIIIEDDVWIGPCVTILKGVRVGRGAVIEAGSLITRDVPAGARVMGNPAKVVS
jgi:acetyltransferase-like isoleucine patch superfamily enzyme